MTGSAGRKQGLTAALDQLGPGEPPRETGEQLALLPGMRDQGDGGEIVSEGAERKPGRPKGAKNKRTKEWVDYLGGRYGTPLERLAQLYSADPVELAQQYHLKPKDAVELMKSAAVACLPYMHEKQPVAVDVTGKGRMVLVIGNVGEDEADQAAEEGLSVVLDLTAQHVNENDEKSEG